LANRKLTPHGAPIVGIAGWKKSGKTTLAVRLIEEFTRRGLRVASIKHAHHEFQIDDGDTDSARHRRAGAAQVAVVSGRRWALVTELADEPEPNFAEVVAALAPADLVIVEGYKTAAIPKIEARRAAQLYRKPLAPDDPHVIAVAADHAAQETRGLPVLPLDDVTAIADFIERAVGPFGVRRARGQRPGAGAGD
jgi:molybdopterin-guanine dinucleotide biosynthesis protein B